MKSSISHKLFATVAVVGLMVSPLALLAREARQPAKPYLGVGIEAKSTSDQPGVTLRDVSAVGPAAKAGLAAGDRIVMLGKTEVKTFADLKNVLANHKPGDQVVIKAMHEGKEKTYNVTLGETPVQVGEDAPKTPMFLGVLTGELTPELKDKMGVKVDKGAVVAKVLPGSPAAEAGMHEHDVITQVGKVVVSTPEELREAIQKVGAGKEVVLKVMRGDKDMEMKVRLHEMAQSGDFHKFFDGLPGGPEGFSGKMPEAFDLGKMQQLEKKVQELEKRLQDLEKPNK
jgi:S1-C subfamily serine protease